MLETVGILVLGVFLTDFIVNTPRRRLLRLARDLDPDLQERFKAEWLAELEYTGLVRQWQYVSTLVVSFKRGEFDIEGSASTFDERAQGWFLREYYKGYRQLTNRVHRQDTLGRKMRIQKLNEDIESDVLNVFGFQSEQELNDAVRRYDWLHEEYRRSKLWSKSLKAYDIEYMKQLSKIECKLKGRYD